MNGNKSKIVQIRLPDLADKDSHPRLLVNGRGIHAGDAFEALMPDGEWHMVTIEMRWEVTGPDCWYIATDGYRDISPLGLFVKI